MHAASSPSTCPDERRAIVALSTVGEIGSVTHFELRTKFGSASRALEHGLSASQAGDAYRAAGECVRRANNAGLELVTIIDEKYPQQLLHLHSPPPVLWARGDWNVLNTSPLISVVGTRRATSYGLRTTREIVTALARAGATIVSGMALGIDAAAHRNALDAKAPTIAVLGTGADIAYPRAHTALHREIAERGLILSEFPPGARAGPGSFPQRNRIIAGLSALTIVVEAPVKSGALHTSKFALEIGRDVAAVPGPIDMPQNVGTNELIRDGAHAITSVADALHLAGLWVPPESRPALVDEAEIKVWNALGEGGATLDELCSRSGLPVSQCLTAVTGLEVRGAIECALTGEIRRR